MTSEASKAARTVKHWRWMLIIFSLLLLVPLTLALVVPAVMGEAKAGGMIPGVALCALLLTVLIAAFLTLRAVRIGLLLLVFLCLFDIAASVSVSLTVSDVLHAAPRSVFGAREFASLVLAALFSWGVVSTSRALRVLRLDAATATPPAEPSGVGLPHADGGASSPPGLGDDSPAASA